MARIQGMLDTDTLCAGEMSEVGSRGRAVASKSGLASSKLLRALYGEATVDDLKRHVGDGVPREHLIAVLALHYLGNTEDKIGYIFAMYGATYASERKDDAAISSADLEVLLEYMALYNPVPEELVAVFDDCKLGKDSPLTNSAFLHWLRKHPALLQYVAAQLPSVVQAETKTLSVKIPDPLEPYVFRPVGDVDDVISDPLNMSPSMRQNARHHQSFDIVGGDSSEDSDDSESEQDCEFKKETTLPPSPPRSAPPSPPKPTPYGTPPLHDDPHSHPKKHKNNPIGKFGRAVGGGIRTILHPQKKGRAAHATTATLCADGENHHYIGGYLNKVSDGKWAKRNWHLRWFVLDLERGVLSYYKSNPSSIVHSPHGSVAFYDDFDLHFPDSEAKSTPPTRSKPHPWYRGSMDLNQPNVSLLFDKQYGHHAPNKFIFQVSNSNIGEMDSKKGLFQYKLCANSEEEFMQWTNAIAQVINRKHAAVKPEAHVKETLQQQLHRQKSMPLLSPDEQNTTNPPTSTASSEAGPPIVPLAASSLASSHKPQLVWQLRLSIDGQQNCLLVLAAFHVWCYVTLAYFGFLVQVPLMGLATLYFFRHVPRKSTRKATKSMSAEKGEDNGNTLLPCLATGTCCLHATADTAVEDQIEEDEDDEAASLPPPPTPRSFRFDMLSSCAQSTNDDSAQNAWSFTSATTFNVRSKDYKKSKKKEASQAALFDFVGVDVFRTDGKIDCIADHVNIPDSLDRLFVLHAQLPLYAPSIFNNNYDGPGASLVMYWSIPKAVQNQLHDPETPVHHLLKRFFESANEPAILERFKVIAQVVNEKDCGLKGYGKTLLQKNNATPVLTRPQHRIYHRDKYTEVDVDVHIFSLIARSGINALIDKTSNMIIDVCFVLQGDNDAELPEHILGVSRLVRMDLAKAKHLDQLITQ
ncbi:Aste57867_10147 [Aphanomyces stellatus]|uniref:Aste57867_10147 protein n=1 Tax=Aphanomyces stellatus TaxID=120398 RepID=A0A485KQ30_9STRA|nr:hypothetical protein As57867_010108 [Aphanomyces stellatus]VFT87023.1 Aste57867_10147 [Aphanomyces stellatus]